MTQMLKSYTDKYFRTWTGPFAFTQAEIAKVPGALQGVYQLLYRQGTERIVGYIGIATGATIRERLKKHLTGQGNWALGRLSQPQNWEFVYWVCDAESASQIESHIISDAKPPFNVRPEFENYIANITMH